MTAIGVPSHTINFPSLALPSPSLRLSEVLTVPLMRINRMESLWLASHMPAHRWDYYVNSGLVEVTDD